MKSLKAKPRGFAALTPKRRSEIASMGGKEAHLSGRAHVFSSEEAREAGRKGGLAAKTYGRKSALG